MLSFAIYIIIMRYKVKEIYIFCYFKQNCTYIHSLLLGDMSYIVRDSEGTMLPQLIMLGDNFHRIEGRRNRCDAQCGPLGTNR